jgi:hypothetical protein
MRFCGGGFGGLVMAVAFGFGASACVATATPPAARGVAVNGPPPAPMNEPRPPQPTSDATWIAGYWHWTGMQYAWIPGHWENAPPGATWAAPQYSSVGGSYFYQAGQWSRPTNANAIR